MKVFNCSSLTHNCIETVKAQTEDRLAELVSVHLRDSHGMMSIPPKNMAEIKKLFTSPAASDAVDRIFEKYNCNNDPECSWRYIAAAEAILTGRTKVHERELKAA